MAEFLAYVDGLRREIDGFLAATRLRAEPPFAPIDCGYSPQHFVPPASLASHSRTCHGDRHCYDKHDSHAFFYQSHAAADQAVASLQVQDTFSDVPSDGNDSLVDSATTFETALPTSEPSQLTAAITALAPHAAALYATVEQWRRIPRACTRLFLSEDSEANTTLKAKLARWIKHEIARHQELASADDVDTDLVEYVLGLLDHPEFCHPDLIAVELEEFLGATDVKAFVLALWKFVIVEIGIQILPTAPTDTVEQSLSVQTSEPIGEPKPPPPPVTVPANPPPSRARRRPTYRAKATRAGPYDMVREILASSMAQLSEETGRELVLVAPPAALATPARASANGEDSSRFRTPVEHWSEYTDALHVRDMARHRPSQESNRRRDAQRSRRRSSSPSRGSHHRSIHRRPNRSRSRSRSRSRERSSRRRYADQDRETGSSSHRDRERRSRDRGRRDSRDSEQRTHR